MQLIGSNGYGIELRPRGYQFPDHPDARVRKSWLMIDGSAQSEDGAWSFSWQALSPDDAILISMWLRQAAQGELPRTNMEVRGAAPTLWPDEHQATRLLAFVEPNLTLEQISFQVHQVNLEFGLDQEFSPPWSGRAEAGHPCRVSTQLTPAELIRAADDWDAENSPYPP